MSAFSDATLSPERSGESSSAAGGHFHWDVLACRVLHPIKVAYIEALLWIGEPVSPSDMVQMYGDELSASHVGYHAAGLVDLGAIQVVDAEVREATKHLYALVPSSHWH